MKLKGSEKDKENAQMHALIGTICQIKNKQTPVNITAWQFHFDHCYQAQVHIDVLSVVIPRKGRLSKFSGKTLGFGDALLYMYHNACSIGVYRIIQNILQTHRAIIQLAHSCQFSNIMLYIIPPPHLVFILNYKYQVNTLSFSHKDTIKQAPFYYCLC